MRLIGSVRQPDLRDAPIIFLNPPTQTPMHAARDSDHHCTRHPRCRRLAGLLAPLALLLGVAPTASADCTQIPDPTAADLTPHAQGNPPHYTVLGQDDGVYAYTPGHTELGRVTWFGLRAQGRRTSSGEPFDLHALTGAHPSLPLPSLVRVTAVDTQRSTVVRVNDRSPLGRGRIIGLSYAAACKLGVLMHPQAEVMLELLALPPTRR